MPAHRAKVPATYEDAVVEHLVWARARSRMLEDLREDKPWDVDLAKGTLAIGKTRTTANLLGTFASGDRTFLWGWENPAADAWSASLAQLDDLRAILGEPGYEPLGERLLSADDVNINELAHVCGELAGGFPVFVGRHDAGAVLLLVTGVELSPETMPLASYAGVFLSVADMTEAPLRPCIERFLERAGWKQQKSSSGLSLTRADQSLAIAFDELGRIGAVNATLQPGAKAAR
jgi:hypothetical protein